MEAGSEVKLDGVGVCGEEELGWRSRVSQVRSFAVSQFSAGQVRFGQRVGIWMTTRMGLICVAGLHIKEAKHVYL